MCLAEDDHERLKALAGQIDAEELLRCFRILFSAEMDITHSDCPRIALELCLLEMITLRQALPLEDMLESIQALSAGRHQSAGRRPAVSAVRRDAAAVPGAQPRNVQTSPQPSEPGPAAAGLKGDAADFIEFVRAKNYIRAVSHLQQCIITLDGDRLRIQVSQSFHADWLREKAAQARLNELATEFFARQVRIEVEENLKKKSPDNDRLTKRREAGIIRAGARVRPSWLQAAGSVSEQRTSEVDH